MTTLKCIQCGDEKLFECFVKDNQKPLGVRPTCKDCRKKYLKKWNALNSDKIKKANSKYNTSQKRKECSKRYYELHKKEKSNKLIEKKNLCTKLWKKTERGRASMRLSTHLRSRRIQSVKKEKITIEFIDGLLKRQNHKCAISGQDLNATGYHIDHIRPISKGGTHTKENLQLLSPKVNLEKGSKWN